MPPVRPLYPREPTFEWQCLLRPRFLPLYPPAPDVGSTPGERLSFDRKRHWCCRSRSNTGRSSHLREKLIKIGAKVARHGCYITFQLSEVAIPISLFANILRLIDGLRPAPLRP